MIRFRPLLALCGLFQLFSCAQTPRSSNASFPTHWWKEVPRSEAASWEILPQEAGPGEVILSKRNELGRFSNFSETPFVYRGICYPNVEAFWQMMKFPEGPKRSEVARMKGPAAKKAGSEGSQIMKAENRDWVTFEGRQIPYRESKSGEHFRLITEAMAEKLRQNPELQKLLLSTGDLKLLPDHEVTPDSPPEWKYFEIWMKYRDELRRNKFPLKSREDLSLRTCGASS